MCRLPRVRRLALPALVGVVCACLRVGAGTQAPAKARDSDKAVRPAAIAGQFYPLAEGSLRQAVQALLAEALPPRANRPLAILVPHAGYQYSGAIAADAFRQAAAHRYDVVVVIGTNHTAAGAGKMALPSSRGFRTPLGIAEIDRALADALLKECGADCAIDDAIHAREHSIEVQLPFIQHLFPEARLVPVVAASLNPSVCNRFGRALGRLLKDRQALIVASSDLSHFPAYAGAVTVDRQTLRAAAGVDPDRFASVALSDPTPPIPELGTRACGAGAIMAAEAAAQVLGATRATVISYANSGDTALGDRDRVVGYGAIVWTAGETGADVSVLDGRPAVTDDGPLQPQDGKAMLAFARETIRRFLTTQTAPLARGFDARLRRQRGVFVTLRKHDALRGCIGNMIGEGPLLRLAGAMALQAAFNDPRFEALRPSELSQVEIEISVLTPLSPVARPAEIVVGRDGVVLRDGSRQAVFLPQVATEQGWTRDDLLDNLCLKAGLPASRWRQGVSLWVFQADVFRESRLK